MRKLTVEELCRLNLAAYREADKLPVVVVLDNIRSLHNVGSVFRTADAFRLAGLCLCGITGCPRPMGESAASVDDFAHSEIHKTALGAEESVAWTYYADTLDAVRHLQHEGYTVLAVEQVEGSTPLTHFRAVPKANHERTRRNDGQETAALPSTFSIPRYAIVLGNEVKGVRQDVVDACDGALEIPQYGTKHSLNVSVTAGIVMWELQRQLRSQQ